MRNFLSRLIGENIQVRFSLDPHLGLIKMDPAQAQQILLNLVLNARDAMPTGGNIAVSTSNCRVQMFGGDESSQQTALPCALFVVEDDGAGMDATTRAHLFEPFFTTKLGMGTGLGLSTVHGVVSRNGGLIHVDSELGRGTRVSVLLPLATEVAPEGSGEENPYLARNLGIHSLKEERLP
jgi:signal transduction histidine kinase